MKSPDRRPVYRRTIPRHHDLNPVSVTRWNRLLHEQAVRLNRARKAGTRWAA